MKSICLLVAFALLGTACAVMQAGAPAAPVLQKPIILNPLAEPAVKDNLAKLSDILAREPPVAHEKAEENDEEDPAEDDLDLLDDDDCDKIEKADKCGKKDVDKEDVDDVKKMLEGGDSAASSSGDDGAKKEKGGVSDKIKSLQKMIDSAMELSKALPEKVKQLEALKGQEESTAEKGATGEAESTLKEHSKLMSEMAEHIQLLQAKLEQLSSKKKELEASDAKLRSELNAAKK